MTELTEVLARAMFDKMRMFVPWPESEETAEPLTDVEWAEIWDNRDNPDTKAPGEGPWGILQTVQAQLAALDAAGYQIVPKEPTPAMLTAGNDTLNSQRSSWAVVHEIYRAMSEVAPKP
jgi:hypothetical protein